MCHTHGHGLGHLWKSLLVSSWSRNANLDMKKLFQKKLLHSPGCTFPPMDHQHGPRIVSFLSSLKFLLRARYVTTVTHIVYFYSPTFLPLNQFLKKGTVLIYYLQSRALVAGVLGEWIALDLQRQTLALLGAVADRDSSWNTDNKALGFLSQLEIASGPSRTFTPSQVALLRSTICDNLLIKLLDPNSSQLLWISWLSPSIWLS